MANKSSEDRRLANAQANKEAIRSELAKSNDPSLQREATRQANEISGIKAERAHAAGKDPGKRR